MAIDFPDNSGLFSGLAAVGAQRPVLGQYALGRGATKFRDGQFREAAAEFERAVGYDPGSVTALRFLARSYRGLGDTEKAVQAYDRASRVAPQDTSVREELGLYLLDLGRVGDARRAFEENVRRNPGSVPALSSLGYFHLSSGNPAEAETAFRQVVSRAPTDGKSHYSLGLALSGQGRFDEALLAFDTALNYQPGDAATRAEIARAHFALDDRESAEAQVQFLESRGDAASQAFASTLRQEFFLPAIAYADTGSSTFFSTLGPRTALTSLSPDLAAPGSSKLFSMTFQFNQEMDISSIQNSWNWSISRAAGGDAGGVYNHGANITPAREVSILPYPVNVVYDADRRKATVYFRVTQNAAGDGLIDPSHWTFQFRGVAADGSPMDPRGDQYNGYAFSPF